MAAPRLHGTLTSWALAASLAAAGTAGANGVGSADAPSDTAAAAPDSSAAAVEPTSPFPDPAAIPALDVVVVVDRFGQFRIRLDREAAPNHVAHFLSLAASGFYDGMSFHRVIPRLLLQAGNPTSRDEDPWNDDEDPVDYRLPAEASSVPQGRGTVSMAWRGDEPGTAGSQWLVALSDTPALSEWSTPIGKIVEGLDTCDRIAQVSTYRNWNPVHRVHIEAVRVQPVPVAPEPAATEALAEEGP